MMQSKQLKWFSLTEYLVDCKVTCMSNNCSTLKELSNILLVSGTDSYWLSDLCIDLIIKQWHLFVNY